MIEIIRTVIRSCGPQKVETAETLSQLCPLCLTTEHGVQGLDSAKTTVLCRAAVRLSKSPVPCANEWIATTKRDERIRESMARELRP